MKNLKIKSRKARLIFPLCVVLLSLLTICCNDELKVDKETFFPPKADEESRFDIFYPDSGGFGTKLILKGYNFGTDTNYIKVTVNDKKAKVIRANDNIIYAIVPSRADTGYVRLYLKKGEEFEEFTSETEFRYLFKSNVSTLFGVPGKAAEDNRLDGPYAEALLRRPWQIVTDNDGTIYFVDEGRGQSKNGALRKASNGNVETLVYDNNGVFQSPNGVVFSLNEDTLFIPNRWTGSDVKTDVNIVFSTRDANFVNTKALVTIPKAGTNSVAVHPKTGEVFFDHNSEGAVYRHTGFKRFIGVCNIPIGMKMFIRDVLMLKDSDDLSIDLFGLNHMVFIKDVLVNGKSRFAELLDGVASGQLKASGVKNIFDLPFSEGLIRSLNLLPCSYLLYYFKQKEMLAIEMGEYYKGGARAQVVQKVEKQTF